MEREGSKRKSSEECSNELSDPKQRKIHTQTTINNRESCQRSTLTEKIVSLWKTGSGPTSLSTQEGRDIVRQQEFETKCGEADKIIQSIKKKLICSEENVAELNILLRKEATEKQNLLNKMSTIWELITNISQHINYITESMDRFDVQTNDLSAKYDNVIAKLQSDNVALETEVKQLNARHTAVEDFQRQLKEKEMEFNELKRKCEIFESQILQEKEETRKVANELENNKKKLLEIEMVEKPLKVSIAELKEMISIENNRLEQINNIEEKKYDEIRDSYESNILELRKNLEETEKQLREIEASRTEMLKSLEEKNQLIEKQKQEVNLYQKQGRELLCQLSDTGLNFQRTKDEKAELETQLHTKNTDLVQLKQEVETITMEKCELTKEISKLNASLKEEAKVQMELSADLTRCKIKLQETINRSNDMNQHLHQNNEEKEYEVKNLQMEIESLKQKLDQILTEKTAEIQGKLELEQKYESEIKIQREKYVKCLVDLDKLSNSMENLTKQDLSVKATLSRVTAEKEQLKKEFSNEKTLIQEKLNKSEELLVKKTDMEKELKEKLLKLQVDLTNAEKKYKDLVSTKENKIMTLEKKLSNLGLSISQTTPKVQTRKNTAKTAKDIRIKEEEIITTGKIKSILKPLLNAYSPKSSPKCSPKKISFNFGSDSSEDLLDVHHQNSILSCEGKFDDLVKTPSHSSITQLSVSQSATPETPKANKFFKSRSNS